MPTVKDLDRLKDQITSAEARLTSTIPAAERRHGLIALARVMDVLRVASLATDEAWLQAEWHHWCSHSWPKALRLFLDESTRDPGPGLFQYTDAWDAWAKKTLRDCLEIAKCEQALALTRYGLIELVRASQKSYLFRTTADRAGLEAEERADQHWLRGLVADRKSPDVSSLRPLYDDVIIALDKGVRRVRGKYIEYDTNPMVDEYYHTIATIGAEGCAGWDCFPADATFGGHRFALYRGAVTALIAHAIKHEAYCWRLQTKYGDIDLRNVLTMPVSLDVLEAFVASRLDCTSVEAGNALEMTALTHGCTNLLKDSGPAPPLITIGERRALPSFAVALGNPFPFMLRKLQARFHDDWYKAVSLREAVFREELNSELSPMQLHTLSSERKIRSHGPDTLTDIDAVAFDAENGIAALFQLKWQDLFSYSMTERNSRLRNFIDKSNKWVDSVHAWSSSISPARVGESLGLPRDKAAGLKEVLLFVISRYHAHYSGLDELDPRAAFATWPQLRRLVATTPVAKNENPLRYLWQAFRERTLRGPAPRPPSKTKSIMGGVTVVIEG